MNLFKKEQEPIITFERFILEEQYAEAFAFAIDNKIEQEALKICIQYIQADDENQHKEFDDNLRNEIKNGKPVFDESSNIGSDGKVYYARTPTKLDEFNKAYNEAKRRPFIHHPIIASRQIYDALLNESKFWEGERSKIRMAEADMERDMDKYFYAQKTKENMTPEKLETALELSKKKGTLQGSIEKIKTVLRLLDEGEDSLSMIIGKRNTDRFDVVINDIALIHDLLKGELLVVENKYSDACREFYNL